MAVLTSFITDFEAYLALWISKVDKNQRQAEQMEVILRKVHGYYDAFTLNGRDGNYTTALTHYQTMLGLLNVANTESEWDVTTTDLQTFFGGIHPLNNQTFQTATFANPLIIDVNTYKNWKCTITGNTVIYLTNMSNGDNGQMIFKIDNVGGYTVSLSATTFTRGYGTTTISPSASASNLLTWTYDGTDVHYTVCNA